MTENGANCYKPQLYRGLMVFEIAFSTEFSTASVNRRLHIRN
jgi:hypothetical protein